MPALPIAIPWKSIILDTARIFQKRKIMIQIICVNVHILDRKGHFESVIHECSILYSR